MFKRSLAESPKRIRSGLVSHILLQSGDTPTDNMAIARVEVEPGSNQQPHHHVPEQVYIIISGNGRIQVGSEIADVQTGDLLYIPSSMEHAVENAGSEKLIYISVTVPAFDIEALYDTGQLKK
ncbi:MAG: cupin domain-containing protein [Dissulfurispiraceae bacterium]|jgi:mannose-6-phosphate isomerase-like protein (cupin superfamily)